MVASTRWLTGAVGRSVLERGGSAADAAVAAGSVLPVVAPHLSGIGTSPPGRRGRRPPRGSQGCAVGR